MNALLKSRHGLRKGRTLLAAAVGLGVAAWAWGAGEERPVLRVLTSFDPNTRGAAERVHAFEAENGCWVDWDMRLRSEIQATLRENPAVYDVVAVDEPWIPRLSGRLRPLGAWPPAGEERTFDPLGAWRGIGYGLPMLKNLYLYVYRADVFGDPELARRFERSRRRGFAVPADVERWLEVSRFLAEETAFAGIAAIEVPSEALVIDLLWLLKTAGVDLARPADRADPDPAGVERALRRFREMHGLSASFPNLRSLEGVNEAYERAEVAHVLQWAGLAESLRNPLFSRFGAETGFAPLPGSAEVAPFCVTGDWFLAIPRGSDERRLELAAAFVDWYAGAVHPQALRPESVSEDLEGVRVWSRPRLVRYEAFSRILSDAATAVKRPEALVEAVAADLVGKLRRFEHDEGEVSE